MREDYDVVIGLEVHAELNTNTKVFCSCPNHFGSDTNTNCCPVCIGLPGALPILNKKAVELTIKAGLCMGCGINDIAVFERKNYFYPDLSKAYQISQLERPICIGGGVQLDSGKFIRLNRIHLEEDAGKLIHKNASIGTLIDYNRGGVPLIEMVSEPDITSADEAVEYLNKLRNNLVYAGIAECKMEQGGMRCDVNLSVKKKGSNELGTRTEMKNLNSFRSVQRAIEYETMRQIELVEAGGVVRQETRKWDDEKGESFSMRSKESANDYRYFPDPDLLSVKIERDLVEKLKAELPKLPMERRKIYLEEYSLPEYDVDILLSQKEISDFFDEALTYYNEPKTLANWIMTEVLKYVKTEEEFKMPLKAKELTEVLKMYDQKALSQANAKSLIEKLINEGGDAKELAKKYNLINDISDDAVEEALKQIIEANPKAREDYKVNPDKISTFFVGQVMRATKGKANPDKVKELLNKYLN